MHRNLGIRLTEVVPLKALRLIDTDSDRIWSFSTRLKGDKPAWHGVDENSYRQLLC